VAEIASSLCAPRRRILRAIDQKTDNAIACILCACSSAAASSVSLLDRDDRWSRTSEQNIASNEALKMMSSAVIDFSPSARTENDEQTTRRR
jgi:hypothetical protein